MVTSAMKARNQAIKVLTILAVLITPVRAGGALAQAPQDTATVLLMDVSGSMREPDASGQTKLESAKQAALQLVTAIGEEGTLGRGVHELGLVTFGDEATIVSALTADTPSLQSQVGALNIGRNTNIGDALEKGLDILEGGAGSASQKAIILLSDGKPTRGIELPEEYLGGPVARAQRLGVCIHTVGFGAGGQMNAELLRLIADGSGCGNFYLAEDAFQLVAAYMRLRHESVGQNAQSWEGVVAQGEQKVLGDYIVEPGQELLDVSLVWPGSQLDLELTDPDQTVVIPSYPGVRILPGPASQRVFVPNPMPGVWKLGLIGANVSRKFEPYSVVVSVRPAPPPTLTPPPTPTPIPTHTPTVLPTPTLVPTPTPVPPAPPPQPNMGPGIWLLVIGGLSAVGISAVMFRARRRRIAQSAWLEVTRGPQAGYRVAIRQIPFRIGRALANDWILNDPTISRRHAVIGWVSGTFRIEDIGSSTGTYVNEVPVKQAILHPGDRLRLGGVDLVFGQD